MAWITLVFAGLFEIGWAIGLKYTEGFTRLWPSVLTAGAMVISLVLLGIALRELPVGTAYAVWTGIGRRERRCSASSCSGIRQRRRGSLASASSSPASPGSSW